VNSSWDGRRKRYWKELTEAELPHHAERGVRLNADVEDHRNRSHLVRLVPGAECAQTQRRTSLGSRGTVGLPHDVSRQKAVHESLVDRVPVTATEHHPAKKPEQVRLQTAAVGVLVGLRL
jgi:hypothetical protein